MERLLARLLTCWLPLPKARRKVAWHKLRSWLIAKNLGGEVKLGRNVRFERHCHFTDGSEIGDWSKLAEVDVAGQGKVKIGRYCQLSWDIMIHTSNHDYDGETLPFGSGNTVKDVTIGDCVWIGSGVMLLPGTKIGDCAIVQGGSVVHGEIPPFSIAGGNPAKVFAMRNVEKCKRQLADGKFMPHTKGW